MLTVGCGGNESSNPSGWNVVYETIGTPPISFDEGLNRIRQGEVDDVVLQPDAYPDGAERWYTYSMNGDTLEWAVKGVDVILYGRSMPGGVSLSASETTVGVNEEQLETVFEAIDAVEEDGSLVNIIDERDTFGKPLPNME